MTPEDWGGGPELKLPVYFAGLPRALASAVGSVVVPPEPRNSMVGGHIMGEHDSNEPSAMGKLTVSLLFAVLNNPLVG